MAAETRPTIRVALYADHGCTDAKSREAAFRLLSEAKGISVEKVTSPTIYESSFPDRFDVLILPGGSGSGEAASLGVEGGRRITEFVRNGKGVVAVCAGGYYVTEGWGPATGAVDIINGRNWDSEHWARGEGMIAVEMVGSQDSRTSRTMWFENGPIFVPASMPEVPAYSTLVKYVTDMAAKDAPKGMMQGRDAVVAAPFGKGRVVAFGPHPELSPGLNHWLINSVKWASAGDDGSTITVQKVLEGN